MAKNRRQILWWGLLGLVGLPIAIYGVFPILVPALVKEVLAQQGFARVHIDLGYPDLHSLHINHLAFEKNVSENFAQVELNNIDLEYQIPRLIHGNLSRVLIGNGTIVLSSSASPEPADSTDSFESNPKRSPTIEEFLKPLPPLPFEELVLGDVMIHRDQAEDPLQDVTLNGSVNGRNGLLNSYFTVQGPQIPLYELTLSGTAIGDTSFTLGAPTSSSIPLISFRSQKTQIQDTLDLQGSLEANLTKVIQFVELFFSIHPDLSHLSGTLNADWKGSLPKSTPLESIMTEKIGNVAGNFQVKISLPQLLSYGKELSVDLGGTFSANHDRLSWALSNKSHISANVVSHKLPIPDALLPIIPMKKHHLSIVFMKPLVGHIDLATAFPSLSLDGQIHANYRIQDFPVTLQFSLNHLSGQSLQHLRAKGKFLFAGSLEDKLEPHYPVKQIEWNVSGNMSLEKEQVTLSLAPLSFLKTALLPINDFRIAQTDLTFLKRLTGTYNLKGQTWETDPFLLRIHTPRVQWKDKILAIQDVKLSMNQLKGSSSTWETSGQVVLLGLVPKFKEFMPPTTNWKLKFSATPKSVQGNLLGQTVDTQVSVYGAFQQQFVTKEGRLQIKLAPVTFSPSGFNLQDSIKPWPYPLEMTSGSASALGHVTWTLPSTPEHPPLTITQGKATFTVDRLSGAYDTTFFNDLSTTMTVIGSDTWSMPRPATVTLGNVQSGVEVTDITLKVHLEPVASSHIPHIEISDFSSRMFGGEIFSNPINFDYSKPENSVTAKIKGLDLGQILKLEQQEGLEGTGLLDGTIPLTLLKDGVEIHDATIAARTPGGIIRYHASEATAQSLAKTDSNLELVLQALNNFHYDVLSIKANYQKNGILLLTTRLEGNSPNVGRGKPIHFNLNIEENIPALLKSLRIAKGIEEQLEELLQ